MSKAGAASVPAGSPRRSVCVTMSVTSDPGATPAGTPSANPVSRAVRMRVVLYVWAFSARRRCRTVSGSISRSEIYATRPVQVRPAG
jgi:hypothetical protein